MEVGNADEWAAAQESLNWLHDAVTSSFTFQNDAQVLADGSMSMGLGEASLRVVVQTQSSEQPGGEITFHGVGSVTYDSERDVQPGRVEALPSSAGDLLRFTFGECQVTQVTFLRPRPIYERAPSAVEIVARERPDDSF